VRCLRGRSTAAPDFANRYERTEPVANQWVVLDQMTDLVWQGCAIGRSGSNCSGTAITTDDINEAMSLMHTHVKQPSFDPVAFPNAHNWYYWSSTTTVQYPACALFYSSFTGISLYDSKGLTNKCVRCVRD